MWDSNYKAAGALADASFFSMFLYGALQVLPKIIVSYVVGLGIEFAWAQWKGEEIQEGFLVSGIIIPLIIPVGCPLWALAIAVAFAVVIGKEIFGGTGMNIFNVALITRAFLFFSYPTKMSGDAVWVANDTIFGLGNTLPDTFTCATPLGEIAQGVASNASLADMVFGFIPGSIGETSVIAIAIGAVILLDRHRFLAYNAQRVRRRCCHSIHLRGSRHDSYRLVRAHCARRLLLRCSLHGYRPRNIGSHTVRTVLVRRYHRHRCRYRTRNEPGLPVRYDARHPLHEYVRSAHRLLCSAEEHL